MHKQLTRSATAIALALGLGGLTAPAHAQEQSLSLRAASAVGEYIARQGNAALVRIREELKRDLRKQIEPYLPDREDLEDVEAERPEAAPQPAP